MRSLLVACISITLGVNTICLFDFSSVALLPGDEYVRVGHSLGGGHVNAVHVSAGCEDAFAIDSDQRCFSTTAQCIPKPDKQLIITVTLEGTAETGLTAKLVGTGSIAGAGNVSFAITFPDGCDFAQATEAATGCFSRNHVFKEVGGSPANVKSLLLQKCPHYNRSVCLEPMHNLPVSIPGAQRSELIAHFEAGASTVINWAFQWLDSRDCNAGNTINVHCPYPPKVPQGQSASGIYKVEHYMCP